MRTLVLMAGLLAAALTAAPACASSLDNKPPDQQMIDALEARASQAQPREQCFLYAEIVHQMTELSLKQYQAGNVDDANSLLKKIQMIAQKIHLTLAGNDKRLKNAEILLRHTAFRLNEMLHASNYQDRPLVEQTLAQVNHAQNEAMMQVFEK
ncbi:MAG TPA: hypothetical protein VHD85_08895 [Terracidiphilus sp.]|jgi:hypothetical protein|nr:hypothetical protein [Terracidiphilus sp.]